MISAGGAYDGTTPFEVTATGSLLPGQNIKQFVAVEHNSCALNTSGDLYCWGDHTLGRLGNGSTTIGRNLPPAQVNGDLGILPGHTIVQFAHAGSHGCAITSENRLFCWGSNTDGQVQPGGPHPIAAGYELTGTGAILEGEDVTWVGADLARSTCAGTASGYVYCWGSTMFGNLGPIIAGIGIPFQDAGASGCTLELDGSISCLHPTPINGSTDYSPTDGGEPLASSIVTQIYHNGPSSHCAEDDSGDVVCWGDMPSAFGGQRPSNERLEGTYLDTLTWTRSPSDWTYWEPGTDICDLDYVASTYDGSVLAYADGQYEGTNELEVSDPMPALTSNVWPDVPTDISADGQVAVIITDLDLSDGADDNGTADVYLYDREASEATLLTQTSGGAASDGAAGPSAPISEDGTRVILTTDATNLVTVDADTDPHVLVWTADGGLTAPVQPVDGVENLDNYSGSAADYEVEISGDGYTVAISMPRAAAATRRDILVLPIP